MLASEQTANKNVRIRLAKRQTGTVKSRVQLTFSQINSPKSFTYVSGLMLFVIQILFVCTFVFIRSYKLYRNPIRSLRASNVYICIKSTVIGPQNEESLLPLVLMSNVNYVTTIQSKYFHGSAQDRNYQSLIEKGETQYLAKTELKYQQIQKCLFKAVEGNKQSLLVVLMAGGKLDQ